MNTTRRSRPAAYALLMVLAVVAATLIVLSATLNRTATTSSLNDRNNEYVAGLYAAEAATEKVVARIKYDFANGQLRAVTNNLTGSGGYRATIPLASEDPYWGGFQFTDGQGNSNSTYVQCISATMGFGALQSQYSGLFGWTNIYRVLSNVKMISPNKSYSIINAVQQDLELDLVPVFQFAIFYNSLLEFTWAATLTVNGRTHANNNIYYGSASGNDLTFNSTVTLTGWLGKTNWGGHTVGEFGNNTLFNGSPGYSTNANALQLPIGTNNTPGAVREIINIPPSNEAADSAMGQQRYFNKATVVLMVSNTSVAVTLRSYDSPTTNIVVAYLATTNGYTNLNATFPFLTVSNSFTDLRENDTVRVTDLDIAKLATWLRTNPVCDAKYPNSGDVYTSTGAVPNILYVADCRTLTAGTMNAVRLKNGVIIPTNNVNWGAGVTTPTGFTVATVNPLYIWGHYNCPYAADRGTTNTTRTFPASLVCDAITLLSTNWADSRSDDAIGSSSSGNPKRAVSTTVNAAILAGVVYSTGPSVTTYSGGVMNLPRLLEDWGNNSASIVLTLNTSIVNFYDSAQANTQFVAPGTYYYAPKRQFSFDLNFLDYRKLPPGTPVLPVINRTKWVTPPPNVVNYAGN